MKELYNGACIALVEAIRKNPSFGLDMFPSMEETEQSLELKSFQLCIYTCNSITMFKRKLPFPIFDPKNSYDYVGGSLAYMGFASLTIYIIHIHIFLHIHGNLFLIAFLLWNVAFPQSFRPTALSPLSPKVTACAGGPNALAAISLSRGTLERHHALIRIWIPILTGLIHVWHYFTDSFTQ